MHRLFIAFRAFFRTLGNRAVAEQVERTLNGEAIAPKPAVESPAPDVKPRVTPPPSRSEALTLLATLQREARIIDLVMESLDNYSDAQVGAAARTVLRDCRSVLNRMFGLAPVESVPEGTDIPIPAKYDVGLLRLTGNLAGNPPAKGRLVHPGWRAATCQVPVWNGSAESASVIMPAEVEVN